MCADPSMSLSTPGAEVSAVPGRAWTSRPNRMPDRSEGLVPMADDDDKAALREELRLLDDELAELRHAAKEIRQRVGQRADAPTDPAEVGATIELAEEQEALAAVLEARRENLLERLGEP